MASVKDTSDVSEAYPMTGGHGSNSYANNSIRQRGVVDAAKQLVGKVIAENLDMDILSSSNTFRIADLGCSVGPNTFISVQTILEAVELKNQTQGTNSQIPEFQVFFSDHTLNDFNMLFKSLPPNRKYHAVGVPDVTNKSSPAWNKGRIHISNATDEVVRAYEAEYAKDMERFLDARAQEIVCGGLMVFTLLGRHNGTPHSHSLGNAAIEVLGSSLMDMAKKGVISEEKVDSFNIPTYSVSPQELEAAVERNGCFSIEKLETLPHHVSVHGGVSVAKLSASTMRAATEGLIKQQFGEEILDDLFNLYEKKLEDQMSIFESEKSIIFFVVLSRKMN